MRDYDRDEAFRQNEFPLNGECKLCAARFYVDNAYQEMGLCGPCVRKAASTYWMTHAGEPHEDFDPKGAAEFHANRREKYPHIYKRKQKIPQHLRMTVFERDGFTCKQCGVQKDLRVDHIIPESKGGTLDLSNLQTLCMLCNCKKGRHMPKAAQQ